MTQSSTSAFTSCASWARTSFMSGRYVRRMNRSGHFSHSSEIVCMALMTGMGEEP